MSLIFPYAAPPGFGQQIEVAPGVFWVHMPLPLKLDHVNLWLLKDGDGWCIIDTGYTSELTRTAWKQILQQLQGPVKRLIVTHFHPDHFGLAQWLMDETGAALWMSMGEFLIAHAVWHEVAGFSLNALLEMFRCHGLDEALLKDLERRGPGYKQLIPDLPEHFNRLKLNDILLIDGKEWKILIGYGHAPEHVALYCEELNLLISGDMLLPRISTNISVSAPDRDANVLRWYLESLQKFAQEIPGSTMVLPSHGLPFIGIASRVEALRIHHELRLSAIENYCAENPKSAAELLKLIFQQDLDSYQVFFAMGEVLAHLNYLEQAGRLSRKIGGDGVVRYERIQH